MVGRVLSTIIIELIIIVVGFIAYMVFKTSPIVNYADYSSDYGIRLKYPSDWLKIEAPPEDSYHYQKTYFVSRDAQVRKAQYELDDYKNSKPLKLLDLKVYESFDYFKNSEIAKEKHKEVGNLGEFIEYKKGVWAGSDYYELSDENEFSHDGVRIYSLGRTERQQPGEVDFFAQPNGKVYVLSFKGWSNYLGLSMQGKLILASLEFTKPAKNQIKGKTISEMNWQRHKDDLTGLEMNLPDDWIVESSDEGWPQFYSPERKAWIEIGKWGYIGGDTPPEDFVIIKYDSFEQFKSEQEFTGSASKLEAYIQAKMSEENSLVSSYKKRKIGPYNGFQVEIDGYCGDTDLIFENDGKIYEIYSYCKEYYSDVEEKIFSSLKVF